MHKYLIFDLDGTLAPIGRAMKQQDIRLLKALELSGYRIAICSGKPSYYLCGFVRQTDLRSPILIGENGGTLQFGVDLPPQRSCLCPCAPEALEQLALLRRAIDQECRERIWYQPNELALTPFPKDAETFETIRRILSDHESETTALQVYPQVDCFDILPKNISKASGLRHLAELEGLSPSDFIAVGDGINDIPMLSFADISFAIGDLDYPAHHRFPTITEALSFLLTTKP